MIAEPYYNLLECNSTKPGCDQQRELAPRNPGVSATDLHNGSHRAQLYRIHMC